MQKILQELLYFTIHFNLKACDFNVIIFEDYLYVKLRLWVCNCVWVIFTQLIQYLYLFSFKFVYQFAAWKFTSGRLTIFIDLIFYVIVCIKLFYSNSTNLQQYLNTNRMIKFKYYNDRISSVPFSYTHQSSVFPNEIFVCKS